MKTLLLASVVLGLSSLTGCAASAAAGDDGGELFDGEAYDGGKHDGNSGNDTGSQGQCVTSCTSDMDCQNSCPMVPSGVNCCDTATGVCYAYAQNSCPAPIPDASID